MGVWAKIVKRPANLFRRKCQKCLLRFQRNNVVVYFLWEKYQFFFLSGLWVKNSAFSPKVFQQVCENCIFCVQRNVFDEKIFYSIYKFILLFVLGVIFRRFSKKVFGGVVKTAFYRSGGDFSGGNFFLKFHSLINNFGLSKKNFLSFVRYLQQCCNLFYTTAFYASRGTMWVYVFSQEIISSLFFFGFWVKNSANSPNLFQ